MPSIHGDRLHWKLATVQSLCVGTLFPHLGVSASASVALAVPISKDEDGYL